MAKRIAVLGLGNPVLCDDAVGLRVVEHLRHLLEEDPVRDVDVMASTRAGFELIDILQGYEHAIIVDCLDLPEPTPGRVRSLDLTHFQGSARLNAPHEINLHTAFGFAERLGIPMPGTVEIYAVEAADVRTLTEEMTPEVAASVEPLARELHAALKDRVSKSSGSKDGGETSPPRPYYSPWED
jgi:hydrogenase maturation protease